VSERDKLSFSELDRRAREARREGAGGRPGGERQARRPRASSAAYKRRVEERLFGKRGDNGRGRMEERVRSAHGTPNFLRTFREYHRTFGMPEDPGLLTLLLDLDDESDVARVVEALATVAPAAPAEQRTLLKRRLQNLEMSATTDALADAASQLAARL
jgi:regulator of protease activity HflC (stomatin/prohibitin superfamily)